MIHFIRRAGFGLVFAALTSLAWAEPQGPGTQEAFDPQWIKIDYVQQTGTATNTESIPVYLTLALDSTATTGLYIDVTDPYNFVVPQALLPTNGWKYDPNTAMGTQTDLVAYESAGFSSGYYCKGEFFDGGCASSSTTYDFRTQFKGTVISLAPGEEFSFLFATLVPNKSPVPDGTYNFYPIGLSVFVFGWDSGGDIARGSIALGGGALRDTPFTRVITAVPEPSSAAMTLVGLAMLAAMATRLSHRGPHCRQAG